MCVCCDGCGVCIVIGAVVAGQHERTRAGGLSPLGTWGATPGHPPPSGSAIEGRAPFESSACVSSLQLSACVSSPSVSATRLQFRLEIAPPILFPRLHFLLNPAVLFLRKSFLNFDDSDLPWLLPSPRLARALPCLPLRSSRSLRPLLRLDKVSGLLLRVVQPVTQSLLQSFV